MAQDQIAIMRRFGFERSWLRGTTAAAAARSAWRLIIPSACSSWLCLTTPTGEAFRRDDMAFGLGCWHWFSLAQLYDLPEWMIGADQDGFCVRRQKNVFAPEALTDYRRDAAQGCGGGVRPNDCSGRSPCSLSAGAGAPPSVIAGPPACDRRARSSVSLRPWP